MAAGELDPASIHLPGVHVQRIVQADGSDKRIERRTVRQSGYGMNDSVLKGGA